MPRKPSLHQLAAQAEKLSLEDLKQLVVCLSETLQVREATESSDQSLFKQGWRSEYRKCGKPNCHCHAGIHLHGPYWYRSVREGNRVKKEYLAKVQAMP
jgi:hypothetical protein